MKNKLIIRELNESDEVAFVNGLEEWKGESLHWYSFYWKEGMVFLEMVQRLRNESKGIDLRDGKVPATMFYGFVNGEIVGRIHVRHYLNDFLLKCGGHVGYAIAPRFRKRGYATEMMRQVLPICRSLGIKKMLVTCDDTNMASWKIIESFGGRLENIILDESDQKMTRRYWIDL
jgi:predicted acetyltransferase